MTYRSSSALAGVSPKSANGRGATFKNQWTSDWKVASEVMSAPQLTVQRIALPFTVDPNDHPAVFDLGALRLGYDLGPVVPVPLEKRMAPGKPRDLRISATASARLWESSIL